MGLVSSRGIVPISHTQDTAGPIARTVTDAAILLAAMVGDEAAPAPDAASLRGARIGVARNLSKFDPRVDALFEGALGALRARARVGRFAVLGSNGGRVSLAAAAAEPVRLLLSGPAGGAPNRGARR